MTNKEAKKILTEAFNKNLLCICNAGFDEDETRKCMLALSIATIALDYAPEISEVLKGVIKNEE